MKQAVVVVPETAPAQPYKRTVIDTKKAAEATTRSKVQRKANNKRASRINSYRKKPINRTRRLKGKSQTKMPPRISKSQYQMQVASSKKLAVVPEARRQ